MKYSALIGNPTEHSVSHIMFEELARAGRVKTPYKHLKIDVTKDELLKVTEALWALGFAGYNVTLPHKLDIIPYLSRLDDSARQIGAVNTVKLDDESCGYNTDWMGIVDPIKRFSSSEPKRALIFGSGGAARAAIYACKQLGCNEVYVMYRPDTDAKTQQLLEYQNDLDIRMVQYDEAGSQIKAADLIINATSAGMIGKDRAPFDLDLLSDANLEHKVFLDAVFNPVNTPLMDVMRQRGALTIDGLWMMMYQGVGALSLWLEQEIAIPTDELDHIHALLERVITNGQSRN